MHAAVHAQPTVSTYLVEPRSQNSLPSARIPLPPHPPFQELAPVLSRTVAETEQLLGAIAVEKEQVGEGVAACWLGGMR